MEKSEDKEKKHRFKSLMIDGTKYKTNLTDKWEKRVKWEPIDPKKLISFIPGTIAKLHIKEGQKVKKGTKIMLLEAMKMKNKVEAPFNGTIKKIYVEEGQIVPKNFLMLEFE
jgi:biotin carboxyl carrier protein